MSTDPSVSAAVTTTPNKADFPHPGPFPRNSAETAWKLPSVRLGIFSFLSQKDLVTGLLLSKESFPQAVQKLWRILDYGRYIKKVAVDPARLLKYHSAVRHLNLDDCESFDNDELARVLYAFPQCNHYYSTHHSLRLRRNGPLFADIKLISDCLMIPSSLVDCMHPPLPIGIPSDWDVDRRYCITVYGDRPDDVRAALRAWMAGVGVFSRALELDVSSIPGSLSDILELKGTDDCTPIKKLLLCVSGSIDGACDKVLQIFAGKVENLHLEHHYSTDNNKDHTDLEDIWMKDIYVAMSRYDTLRLSIQSFRHFEMPLQFKGENTGFHLPSMPDDRRSGKTWSDASDSQTLYELVLVTDQQSWLPALDTFTTFPRLSLLAEELLLVGGPLCRYSIRTDGGVAGSASIDNVMTQFLRREINAVIERVRGSRPKVWSRRSGAMDQVDGAVGEESVAGRKRKEDFDSGRKVARRVSF